MVLGPDPWKSWLAFGPDPDLDSRSLFTLGHRSKKTRSFFLSFKRRAGEQRYGFHRVSCCFYVMHVADCTEIYSPSCREESTSRSRKVTETECYERTLGGNTSAPGVGWRVRGEGWWVTNHPSGLRDLTRLMKSVLTRTSSLSLCLHSLFSSLTASYVFPFLPHRPRHRRPHHRRRCGRHRLTLWGTDLAAAE